MNQTEPSNKDQLREELKDIKTIHTVFINKSQTKMNLYYVKDNELKEIWILPADSKDKPKTWGKTGIEQERAYCFKGDRGGIGTAREAVQGLFKWLDLDFKNLSVERLN